MVQTTPPATNISFFRDYKGGTLHKHLRAKNITFEVSDHISSYIQMLEVTFCRPSKPQKVLRFFSQQNIDSSSQKYDCRLQNLCSSSQKCDYGLQTCISSVSKCLCRVLRNRRLKYVLLVVQFVPTLHRECYHIHYNNKNVLSLYPVHISYFFHEAHMKCF